VDSSRLRSIGFADADWHSLTDSLVDEPQALLWRVPRKPGIYVLRTQRPFQWRLGMTDIVYIGHTSGSLRKRIGDYLSPGYSAVDRTNYRVWDAMFGSGPASELAWVTTDTSKEAVGLESLLLHLCLVEFGGRLPLNRSGSRRRYKGEPVVHPAWAISALRRGSPEQGFPAETARQRSRTPR
jgi:hypothetical protein